MMTNHIGQSAKRVKNILPASVAVVALAGPLVTSVSHPSVIRAQSRAGNVALAETVGNVPIVLAEAAPAQASRTKQGASGLSVEKPLAFEAASIKPNNSAGGRGEIEVETTGYTLRQVALSGEALMHGR